MKAPPFLLSAALLFWGFEAGHMVLAAACAAAVESPRILRSRWDLREADFSRISDLCVLGILSIIVYRLFAGWFDVESWFLLKWMPPVLLPLVLAQLYSTPGRVNLSALLLIRPKKIRDGALLSKSVDLTWAYGVVCMLAASAANSRSVFFYAGILVLFSWALLAVRPQRYSLALWAFLLLIAGSTGYGIQSGLAVLHERIEAAGYEFFSNYYRRDTDPYRNTTQMGDIGKLKPSKRILFWVKSPDGGPLLLREASFDAFFSNSVTWVASNREFNPVKQGQDRFTWRFGEDVGATEKRCTVSFPLKNGRGLLKLPNHAVEVNGLSAAAMGKNGMGAVRIEGQGLATYQVACGHQSILPGPPAKIDLHIRDKDAEPINRLVDQLGLKSMPARQVLATLQNFFAANFTYSLNLHTLKKNTTALATFLETTRSGHCEFFATATVLLLRGAGIPARYATGFSVDTSKGGGQWQPVRESNAHAWVLVHIDGNWTNFDTTPYSGLGPEQGKLSLWDRLFEIVARLSFGFAQWRWQGDEDAIKRYAPWVLVLLSSFLLVRLFKRMRKPGKATRNRAKRAKPNQQSASESAFQQIEKRLNQMGFSRNPWQTADQWLSLLANEPELEDLECIRHQFINLYYRYRFDPENFSPEDREHMLTLAANWLEHS